MDYDFQIHGAETPNRRFVWSLRGEKGGVHIWAQFADPKVESLIGGRFYGGVELHYPHPPYDFSPEEPPVSDCWLLHGDCWPDGSSLYFSEHIAPMIRMSEDDPARITEWINAELLDWYRSHLEKEEA